MIKLLLSLLLCLIPCAPLLCAMKRRRKRESPYAGYAETKTAGGSGVCEAQQQVSGAVAPCLLFCVAYAGVLIWWIYDIVLVAQNDLLDANGCALFVD